MSFNNNNNNHKVLHDLQTTYEHRTSCYLSLLLRKQASEG